MSMNAINSENILHNYGGNNVNSLNHILEFDVDDELHLWQNSQYFDDDTLLKQLATKTNTFKILSLNCQSINAKIDQLKIKIRLHSYTTRQNVQRSWWTPNVSTQTLSIQTLSK